MARADQFYTVEDEKLRLSLMAMSDRWDEKVRDHIYRVYNDTRINMLYRGMRMSGMFAKGTKDKVRRKIVEFPSPHVYDFCDATMRALYGPRWLDNTKALNHELIKPWWVVEKL